MSINEFIFFGLLLKVILLTEKAIPLDIYIRFVEGVVFYFL